ncbi:MAG TPA: hypothetical protein DD618_02655 [Acholeplasmatales bacterium]|nr:hypothetical protein [Acholeplasmatales bacterium]
MECKTKRTFLDLLTIYNCKNCPHQVTDEQIIIGRGTIGIYHLFEGCALLKTDREQLISTSKKLRILLKDAIINDAKIFLFYVEDLKIGDFLEIFAQILDAGFHVQVITL